MRFKFTFIRTWMLRILASAILLQTLFFKFSGAEESVYIFTRIGMEPWGRIGIGVLELIAAMLILFPKTTLYGALLAVGLMAGALFFHVTKLGISIQNDGGQLFIYSLLVMFSALILVFIYRFELFHLIRKILKSDQ